MNQTDNNKNTFIKYFDRQYYSSIEKYKQLDNIASPSGFIAPEIIDTNESNRSITFKFIDDLYSTRIPYITHMEYFNKNDNSELFYDIGSLLAIIHKELKLPNNEPWAACKVFDTVMSEYYGADYKNVLNETMHANIHCDFGFSNVNYKETNGKIEIIILDPCPNYVTTFHPFAFASVYIDIAGFSACLDGLLPIKYYTKLDWRKLPNLKEAFFSGYEENSNLKIDRHLLGCISFATVHSYFQNRYGYGVRTLAARSLVYNRIKQNIPENHSNGNG